MRVLWCLLIFTACKPHQVNLNPIATTPPLVSKDIVRAGGNFEWSDEDYSKYDNDVISRSETFAIGNRYVGLSIYKRKGMLTFVNLHDDENTSVQAAKITIDSLGGTLMQLRHSGERNIEFRLGNTKYEADPNRIFTDAGARATLEKLSRYSDEALAEVRKFGDIIVDSLQVEVIFTLHNNTEEGYSALSYLDEYKTDAADVFLNPNRDPDDFFFVTERLFFEELKLRGFNVVLQNNKTATDDGSLSVLAGQRGIPYINVEAQHGHLKEQVEMLYVLYELFQ